MTAPSTSTSKRKQSSKAAKKNSESEREMGDKSNTEQKKTEQSQADQGTVTVVVEDGIAVITIDDHAEKVNTLNERTSADLYAALDRVQSDSAVKAAVLISGKRDFIVGADIAMLNACGTSAEVEALSRKGQAELDKLESWDKPVVAAIDGACMGGGLEVAMACHYRIATDSPKTVLALPEVMLGLLPGAGGTWRLPQLVGLQDALDMMLTGKNIRPAKAKRMGLVDEVVVPYGLRDIAITAAKRLVDGSLKKREPEKSKKDQALEDTAAGRLLVFKQARAMTLDKTQGCYPAPLAILDVVEIGAAKGRERGLAEESRRFGELAMTNESKALMSLFFAQTALKKNRFGRPDTDVKTVGVLGAGLMGAGITLVSVQKGHRVLLKDISQESLARGKKQIYKELNRRTKRKALTPFERDRLMSQVVAQTDYRGFENCDLVIEAVFEDLKLKHRVIGELEAAISDECIVATNTSALPITDVAKGSSRPENVIGMHYFSPVHKMPLLEVITTEQTSKRACAIAVEVGLKQGKTVIVVKDGPGFYTSRILAPYMDEAVLIALEGIDLHDFDLMMRRFGFPVGPITLLDEVGIDVAAHVSKDMAPFFEPRFGERDISGLDAAVKAGYLGRKAGKGFFLYDAKEDHAYAHQVLRMVKKVAGRPSEGKPENPGMMEILKAHGRPDRAFFDEHEVQQRMAMRFLNEAVLCLQDGILADPTDGDVGAVFGLGFPPFHGGPFRYVDTVGASAVVRQMETLAAKFDKRFAPCDLLVTMAKKGEKFHKA